MLSLTEVLAALDAMPDDKRKELESLAVSSTAGVKIIPNPGQQTKAYLSKADIIGYGGAGGGGKGLSLDTKLPTPTGWVEMRDVQTGDILFDEQGNQTMVLQVSEVSNRPCYRLTFDDGSQIVADDVHRWVTMTDKERTEALRRDPEWQARRRAKRPSRAKGTATPARLAALQAAREAVARKGLLAAPTGSLRDTQEIYETQKAGRRGATNHSIAVAAAIKMPDAALRVAPYTLGAWLGDGSKASASIFIDVAKEEIADRIRSDGYDLQIGKWRAGFIRGIQPALREMGLFHNKHIPSEYLRASEAQRLALLQGLMDTDGYCAEDGSIEFCTTDEALAHGAYELIASLGIKASMNTGRAMLNGQDYGMKWRILLTTEVPVFSLPRKAARMPDRVRATQSRRYIVGVEPVESVPTKCIYVDSPSHQFLVGRSMIPTHNTYLSIAKAINAGQHQRSIIFRREGTQADGMIASAREVVAGDARYNGTDLEFSWPDGRSLKFAGLPNADDWRKHAGRERDLMVFDEAAEFLEEQVASLQAWNRGPADVHCQIILPSNPPRSSDGAWYRVWFAPWLDKSFPNPAADGEIRWCVYRKGETIWVDGPEPVMIDGETILPKSRTFIHAKLSDNPYRDTDEYRASLQALPSVLSAQMLHGDFDAGASDDEWQIIPTDWVRQAQRRWRPSPPPGVPLSCVSQDVAQGGNDKTVTVRRFDWWFSRCDVVDGEKTPDGRSAAAEVFKVLRDDADVVIDLGGGWGGDCLAHLVANGVDATGYMGIKATHERSRCGKFKFTNVRSYAYWSLREALDPHQDGGSPLALPDDPLLVQELCAVTYSLTPHGIQALAKDKVKDKIGRSPDRADAVVMAWWQGYRGNYAAQERAQAMRGTIKAKVSHSKIKRYAR